MKQNTPLRVLQVLNLMDYGGIESVVMNYYNHIDKTKVQFDFAVSETSIFPQKDKIQKLGGRFYLLPPISHLPKYVLVLQKIIKENNYKIVHCHLNCLSVFPLFASYLAGAKVRICHNHATVYKGEMIKALAKYILRPFCRWFATDYFACSEYAGRWMYGNRRFHAGTVHVMQNGINYQKFKPDKEIRVEMRKRLDLQDKYVIGHVGRFTNSKNHKFLIELFHYCYVKNDKLRLLLIGDGELEAAIRKKVHQMGLDKAVIFYGNTDSIEKLYQAMDVFCFPSFYEGLGLAAVEAQACNVPVVASKEVPKDVVIGRNIQFLDLKDSMENWEKAIYEVKPKEYDIELLSKDITAFYEKNNR